MKLLLSHKQQGKHLLAAQLPPWSYSMPTEIVYECIKPCQRVYRFCLSWFLLLCFTNCSRPGGPSFWEKRGLLSLSESSFLSRGRLPGDYFSKISFIFVQVGVQYPWALEIQFIRLPMPVEVQKQSWGWKNIQKVSKAKAAVWSFLTFL